MFESIELIKNPWKGFREGGLRIFCNEKEIIVFDGQSANGQIFVILTFIEEEITNVDDWFIPYN